MLRRLSTLPALLSGLLTAQAVATLHVHLSNLALNVRIENISRAGYLYMPNENAVSLLKNWQAALAGGLFFTLSIGAGVTLFSLAALWTWDRLFSRSKIGMAVCLLAWAAVLTAVNLGGIPRLPSLYFLIVPPVVYLVYRRTLPSMKVRGAPAAAAGHLACIALLALAWATQTGDGLFVRIRDNLLLTNPVGVRINDFYYRYTHFSAETISALQHKMFKTYSLRADGGKTQHKHLAAVLAGRGYFSIPESSGPDIQIVAADDRLAVFRHGREKPVFESSLTAFLRDPGIALKTISKATDPNAPFRRTIFYSLLFAFPIVLYLVLHAVFAGGSSLFLSPPKASLAGSFVCLLVGTALVLPVHLGRDRAVDPKRLPQMLSDPDWRTQVAALKTIGREKMEIGQFSGYRRLMDSPHIAVRYWLAQALGKSRLPGTYPDLLALLRSPQANVVCQAIFSIGVRGGPEAVPAILDFIENSNHWYVLRYAYQALRDLGWRQKRSV